MSRPLWIGLFLATVLLVSVLVWGLGIGTSPRTPAQQAVPGLTDSVEIGWTSEHQPIIKAASRSGTVTALGYIHGLNRGWTALLWRQTAMGRLGRWFGPGVTSLDRHARRLGLAHHARAAYDRLPEADRARLQAYAAGMNEALRTEYVQQLDEFVHLDITPKRWAPWHTLLVERLLAWAATRPLSAPAAAPPAVAQFEETDRQFRRWLHLHGWSRSIAWAVHPDSTHPTLFQRHVLGASATPIVQEVLWDRPDASLLTWATFPGTLVFPTGSDDQRAWASLLHSPVRLAKEPARTADIQYWYERLAPEDSDEQLVRVERLDNALVLATRAAAPSVPLSSILSDSVRADAGRLVSPDTAWTIRWAGFTETTDLGAWLERAGLYTSQTSQGQFGLFAADGLRLPASGEPTVLGSPSVVTRPQKDLIAVGRSRWTRFQAAGIADAMLRTDSVAVGRWSASDSSAWAAALLPALRPTLRPFAQQGGTVGNAATYLQNWDYGYASMSIGAVLFDEWMHAYRDELKRVPMPTDTVNALTRPLRQRAFQQTLDTLTSRLGSDARRWRWERIVENRHHYPVWSADSLVNADLSDLRTTRYAPLKRTASGHPSAPSGGPSLVDPSPVAPSPDTWEGWVAPGGPMTVRRHRFDPESFFARWRLQAGPPSPRRLRPEQSTHETVLIPPE